MPSENLDWDSTIGAYLNTTLTKNVLEDDSYPRRTFLSGINYGLTFKLKHQIYPLGQNVKHI